MSPNNTPTPPMYIAGKWHDNVPVPSSAAGITAAAASRQLFSGLAKHLLPESCHDFLVARRQLSDIAILRTSSLNSDLHTPAVTSLASQVHGNISSLMRTALRDLPSNWVIGLSDKNMGLTVMDTQWYDQAIVSMLHNTATFKPLWAHEAVQVVRQVRDSVRRLADGISRALEPHVQQRNGRSAFHKALAVHLDDGKPSKYYIMPKLHKSPIGKRGISPMHNFWSAGLHLFFAKLMYYQTYQLPWCIMAAVELLRKVEGRVVSAEHLFWTADIHQMYTEIPLDKAETAMEKRMASEDFRCLHYPYPLHRHLLHTILYDTLVEQRTEGNTASQFFKQQNGIPMGSSAAPIIAVLYVADFETPAWRSAFELYVRYIDDLCGDWVNDVASLRAHLNRLFPVTSGLKLDAPTIRTARELVNDPLPFLDLELYAVPCTDQPGSYIIQCRPYTKKLAAHQYVAYRSGHPASVKRSVVKAELVRQRRLCSTVRDWTTAVQKVTARFLVRGYTTNHIADALTLVPYSGRQQCLDRVLNNFESKRLQFTTHPWRQALLQRGAGVSAQIPRPHPEATVFAFRLRYDPSIAPFIRALRRVMQMGLDLLTQRRLLPDGSRVVIAYSKNKNILDWLRRHNNAVRKDITGS
jgi:hypothetical protein